MTRQVCFSFRPTDVKPGTCAGRVRLDDGTDVPLSLRIAPLRFPSETALRLGGWSYTNQERMYGVTPQNREVVVRVDPMPRELEACREMLAAARRLLATAPARVLDAEGALEYRWDAPKDRSLADHVRAEVLDMLAALAH